MTQRSTVDRAQTRSIWVFMAATAMATTVSTLAATAMVQADEPAAVDVTCECESTPAVAPATVAPPPVPQTCPPQAAEAPATQPRRVPRVRQVRATVDGALDKDIIRRVVRSHINEVRYCYNEGLKRDPDLSGRVTVQFTIDAEGEVSEADALTSTIEDEAVESCIAGAAKRWHFPKPTDGAAVTVAYPFALSPG